MKKAFIYSAAGAIGVVALAGAAKLSCDAIDASINNSLSNSESLVKEVREKAANRIGKPRHRQDIFGEHKKYNPEHMTVLPPGHDGVDECDVKRNQCRNKERASSGEASFHSKAYNECMAKTNGEARNACVKLLQESTGPFADRIYKVGKTTCNEEAVSCYDAVK